MVQCYLLSGALVTWTHHFHPWTKPKAMEATSWLMSTWGWYRKSNSMLTDLLPFISCPGVLLLLPALVGVHFCCHVPDFKAQLKSAFFTQHHLSYLIPRASFVSTFRSRCLPKIISHLILQGVVCHTLGLTWNRLKVKSQRAKDTLKNLLARVPYWRWTQTESNCQHFPPVLKHMAVWLSSR